MIFQINLLQILCTADIFCGNLFHGYNYEGDYVYILNLEKFISLVCIEEKGSKKPRQYSMAISQPTNELTD